MLHEFNPHHYFMPRTKAKERIAKKKKDANVCKSLAARGKRKEWIRLAREDAQQKNKKEEEGGCLPSQSSHFEAIVFFKYFSTITPEMKFKGFKGSC